MRLFGLLQPVFCIFPQIQSVADILSMGYKIGMSKATSLFFLGADELDQQIIHISQQCTSTGVCLQRILNDTNFVMATSKMHAEQLIVDYLSPRGISPFRILPGSIATPPIEMILIKVYQYRGFYCCF